MKFVIDQSIPFIKGVFEPYAEVLYREGPLISNEDLLDADALIIRTRTKCNEALLHDSPVKIIATATAATDNIDAEYCASRGIFFKNASGCNAGGVSNYVFSALFGAAARKKIQLKDCKLGIIGLGSIGERVESMGRALGFKIMRNDPRKAQEEWYTQFYSLEQVLEEADIVTIHTPLNESTKGMANAGFFSRMKPGAIFINTAQGDIVVEEDLIAASHKLGPIIIDAWSHEPTINTMLMSVATIATPHIAGYSLQSKQIGSSMAVRAVARFFSIKDLYDFYPQTDIMEYQAVKIDVTDRTQGQIAAILQYNYPIFTDDFLFRTNPTKFEQLRTNYRFRREFYI